jgi:hypothetical protein
MVGTLIASRGLIHTRTMECVLKNLIADSFVLFSHDRPIPDAQNYLVEEALKTKASHFWFVEEDNTFPDETLTEMLAMNKMVVAVDYPVGDKQYSTIMRKDGKIYWCGLGCTLISRQVFEQLDKPWFRTDYSWKIINMETMELKRSDVPNKYGGHDINFGLSLLERGIEIAQLPNIVGGHLRGRPTNGTNKDVYTFNEMKEILHYQNY